jgi:hypothetical protein
MTRRGNLPVPHALAACALLLALGAAPGCARAADPLADEIARWREAVARDTAGGEMWRRVRPGSEPLLRDAARALERGRRDQALHLLAAVRPQLRAARWMEELAAAGGADSAGFEREWSRRIAARRAGTAAETPQAWDARTPPLLRAVAEAAGAQVRVYEDASLEYGRNTMAVYGLFYLGIARAQEEFPAWCRAAAAPVRSAAPPLRAMTAEIDSLEREIVRAYRPPASIERHPDFIVAHALLKEARELDAAGRRHGALLRYLESARRFARLRPAADTAGLAARFESLARRAFEPGADHGIARVFAEAARSAAEDSAGTAFAATAIAAATDALERYFAAIGPAAPPAPAVAPAVTVTLVRWPYT